MGPYALPAEAWAAGLVFARVGAIVMLIPGLGDAAVPPRIRLSFALLLSLCLIPVARPALPFLPLTLGGMAGFVIKELLIGLMIGAMLRLFISALAVAGETISIQTTLSFAQTTNPAMGQQGTSIASFLGVLGVTLIFATNLHHLFLGAIADSYRVFAPTGDVPVRDAGLMAARMVGQTFALGVQLAAPVIVFSLVFNLGVGLVARVMPQFQVFFVATPLALLLSLSVFALSLGLVGLVWLGQFESFTRSLLRP